MRTILMLLAFAAGLYAALTHHQSETSGQLREAAEARRDAVLQQMKQAEGLYMEGVEPAISERPTEF